MNKKWLILISVLIMVSFAFSVQGAVTQVGALVNATSMAQSTKSAKSGNYLYVVSFVSNITAVIDVSDPTNPTQVAAFKNVTSLTSATDIDISGNFAYVISDAYEGVAIINITDPLNPTQSGAITFAGSYEDLYGLAISGDNLFVVSQASDTIVVVNVTDKRNPSIKETLTDNTNFDNIRGIDISGDLAIVGAFSGDRVSSVNISDPANLVRINTLSDASLTGIREVYVSGNAAYVTAYTDDKVVVINISNPASLSVAGSAAATDTIGIDGNGDFIFVSEYIPDTFNVNNISIPSNPAEVATLTNNTGLDLPQGVTVSGDYAYVNSLGQNGIAIIDVSSYNLALYSPTFEVPTPNSGTHNNTNININVSCDGGNITLWFDTNVNPVTYRINQSTSPANYTTNVTTETTYYYKASCDHGETNSSIRTWVYDVSAPYIELNTNNFFESDNSTIYSFQNASTARLNITFKDNGTLYGFELNITNSTGWTIYTLENTTLQGTHDNFSNTIDVTGATGTYTVNLTAWDAHTSLYIKDYKINKGDNYIKFEDKIKITATGAKESNTKKNKDRYNFEFDYGNNPPSKKVFYLESNATLDYLEHSQYKAHFVDWENKKWIDFEGIDSTPIVTKINDYKFKIEFNNADKTVIFNSIGGLNHREVHYTYELVGSASQNWHVPFGGLTTILLYNSSTFISWNITSDYRNYTQFRLYNSSQNVIDTYNFSVTGSGSYTYNHTFTNLTENIYFINATHTTQLGDISNSSTITVYRVHIANCSERGYPTINFSLQNESSGLPVTGTMDFHFFHYRIDEGVSYYNNDSYTTYASNISHCIFPNGSSVIANVTVEYVYNTIHFNYFIDSINLSNSTKTVTLYVTDSTSQIVYNVKDTFDNDLDGIYIHVQKYDVGTNTYKEVEVLKTDASGNAVGRIELNTAWYRFWIYYHGELELTDGPLKITSTEKNFRLNLVGSDWSDNYENYKDISYDLSFNNATRNFRYVFSDPNLLISKACLGVQRINLSTGNKNVSGSCTTAHSGTILGAIDGNYSGRTYLATAWVIIGGDTFVLDELEQSYATEWQTYDDSDHTGVFVTFLVILSMILIGIWHPVIAIILMLFGFGIMRGLGIHYMSWPMFMALVIMGIVVLYKVGKR